MATLPDQDLALTQTMYWSTCVPRDAFSLSSLATAPALRFSDVVAVAAIEICDRRAALAESLSVRNRGSRQLSRQLLPDQAPRPRHTKRANKSGRGLRERGPSFLSVSIGIHWVSLLECVR